MANPVDTAAVGLELNAKKFLGQIADAEKQYTDAVNRMKKKGRIGLSMSTGGGGSQRTTSRRASRTKAELRSKEAILQAHVARQVALQQKSGEILIKGQNKAAKARTAIENKAAAAEVAATKSWTSKKDAILAASAKRQESLQNKLAETLRKAHAKSSQEYIKAGKKTVSEQEKLEQQREAVSKRAATREAAAHRRRMANQLDVFRRHSRAIAEVARREAAEVAAARRSHAAESQRLAGVASKLSSTILGGLGKAFGIVGSLAKTALVIPFKLAAGAFSLLKSATSALLGPFFRLAQILIPLGAIGGLVIGVKHAITTFAEFENRMIRVKAITEATTFDFGRLNEEVRRLGRTTMFSASQAAEALERMSMAGFSVDESLKALPATLNLAAAGELDMQQAADITVKIMRGMGLAATEVAHATDVLVKATTRSSTTVNELGDAFKFLGPVAKQAGLNLEEVTASIMLLANAGIRGQMAGRTMRMVLLRLQSQPGKVGDELEKLGINIERAGGKLAHISTIVDRFNRATKDMTDVQKSAAIATIVGAEAAAAFGELLAQGGDAIRKNMKEVKAAGFAAKFARDIMKSLTNQFKILQSVANDAAIALGERWLPSMLDIVRAATEVVPAIKDVIASTEPLLQLIGIKMADGLRAFGAMIKRNESTLREWGLLIAKITDNIGRLVTTMLSAATIKVQDFAGIKSFKDLITHGLKLTMIVTSDPKKLKEIGVDLLAIGKFLGVKLTNIIAKAVSDGIQMGIAYLAPRMIEALNVVKGIVFELFGDKLVKGNFAAAITHAIRSSMSAGKLHGFMNPADLRVMTGGEPFTNLGQQVESLFSRMEKTLLGAGGFEGLEADAELAKASIGRIIDRFGQVPRAFGATQNATSQIRRLFYDMLGDANAMREAFNAMRLKTAAVEGGRAVGSLFGILRAKSQEIGAFVGEGIRDPIAGGVLHDVASALPAVGTAATTVADALKKGFAGSDHYEIINGINNELKAKLAANRRSVEAAVLLGEMTREQASEALDLLNRAAHAGAAAASEMAREQDKSHKSMLRLAKAETPSLVRDIAARTMGGTFGALAMAGMDLAVGGSMVGSVLKNVAPAIDKGTEKIATTLEGAGRTMGLQQYLQDVQAKLFEEDEKKEEKEIARHTGAASSRLDEIYSIFNAIQDRLGPFFT